MGAANEFDLATLGAIVGFFSTIIGSFVVACIYGWKLALVCSTFMPLLIAAGYFRFYSLGLMEKRRKESNEAATFACEATSAIRTVASLSIEASIRDQFRSHLKHKARSDLVFMSLSAGLYSINQAMMMVSAAISRYQRYPRLTVVLSLLLHFAFGTADSLSSVANTTSFSFSCAL